MPYAIGYLLSPTAWHEFWTLPDWPPEFAAFLADDDDDGDASATAARTRSISASDIEPERLSLCRISSIALDLGGSCLGRSIDNTSERNSFKYSSLNETPRYRLGWMLQKYIDRIN